MEGSSFTRVCCTGRGTSRLTARGGIFLSSVPKSLAGSVLPACFDEWRRHDERSLLIFDGKKNS